MEGERRMEGERGDGGREREGMEGERGDGGRERERGGWKKREGERGDGGRERERGGMEGDRGRKEDGEGKKSTWREIEEKVKGELAGQEKTLG